MRVCVRVCVTKAVEEAEHDYPPTWYQREEDSMALDILVDF